jgi:hypothetical protein
MAGALWTSYDASFPARWVEAMKKPSRAGGKPAKARPRGALKPKGRSAPKALSHRGAAPARETEVARQLSAVKVGGDWTNTPQVPTLLPVGDAEHQLQVLCDPRSLTSLYFLDYASTAQRVACVSCLVLHAFVHFLRSKLARPTKQKRTRAI